ncbi:ATP-grasp domain-containing protein [Sandarakinorhabdus sp. DWP1-3-1]|uniref:ATP-grasp domain-containing protein n=1 Tax=Sandarakinorhabdus sp. DWP1-3-1 TaxID=2804627 RepID=UPI003CE9DF90
MILFAGIPSEAPIALAIAAAETLRLPHIVFNQRHAAHCQLRLEWGAGGLSGAIALGGSPIDLGAITGIYARMADVGVLPEHRARGRTPPDPAALARATAMCGLFDDLLEVFPGTVVNRPSAMGSNMSKPGQAQLITAHGLKTPPTLVSNEPDAIRAFQAEHGRVVYKSISAVRSIVQELRPGTDLSAVARLPTQFQALVPGTDIRTHVVGEEVFASAITSDAIDYRYADRQGRDTEMMPTELPPDIAARCVALTKSLGLAMAGIDLKRTPDGDWYCFEVNPSPAYSYFEEMAGQPMSWALARLLAGDP